MICEVHDNCGAYIKGLIREHYRASDGPARVHRPRHEVALEREAHRKAVAYRKEFNARKKMEKEQRNK